MRRRKWIVLFIAIPLFAGLFYLFRPAPDPLRGFPIPVFATGSGAHYSTLIPARDDFHQIQLDLKGKTGPLLRQIRKFLEGERGWVLNYEENGNYFFSPKGKGATDERIEVRVHPESYMKLYPDEASVYVVYTRPPSPLERLKAWLGP